MIYDESFAKIKDEKYTFKLPRGTKKTPAPKKDEFKSYHVK